MNLTTWAWVLLPLGVCRAVQIALWDRITEAPRRWLLARLNPEGRSMRDPERPYLSYLLECPWCLSVWVAAVAVGLTLYGPTRQATLAVLLVLSLSLLAVGLDRAFDRFLPDDPPAPEPAPPAPAGPPAHVADAFHDLTGDRPTGSS